MALRLSEVMRGGKTIGVSESIILGLVERVRAIEAETRAKMEVERVALQKKADRMIAEAGPKPARAIRMMARDGGWEVQTLEIKLSDGKGAWVWVTCSDTWSRNKANVERALLRRCR